jgi:hypothetical protein
VSDILATPNVSLTSVGLTFTGPLAYEAWLNLVQTLSTLDTAVQFAIGDALVYGEATYGEKYSQAMDLTGMAYQTLANCVWVSKHVPVQNRIQGLSWTHHRAVAGLPQDEQVDALQWAIEHEASASSLQQHLSGRESRSTASVLVPAGITPAEAQNVLEAYAKARAKAESNGSDDPVEVGPSGLDCVLCDDCPHRTRGGD